MSHGTWNIYKKVGATWTADGTIYRPNEDLELPITSTMSKVALADGDVAYVTPTTKYSTDPFTIKWYEDDGTMKTKIEGYIQNQNDIKIVDHLANNYYGRFTSINSTWLKGRADTAYDIQVVFEQIPSLA
jgi:hypothetical protein